MLVFEIVSFISCAHERALISIPVLYIRKLPFRFGTRDQRSFTRVIHELISVCGTNTLPMTAPSMGHSPSSSIENNSTMLCTKMKFRCLRVSHVYVPSDKSDKYYE